MMLTFYAYIFHIQTKMQYIRYVGSRNKFVLTYAILYVYKGILW